MLKIFSRACGLCTLLFATFGGPEPLVKISPDRGDRAFNLLRVIVVVPRYCWLCIDGAIVGR